jgi:aspartate racemase
MTAMDTDSAEHVIGVIGGMGPQATADLLAKLAAAAPVATEQEHLRVLVDSNPKVPDRNRALAGDGPSPGPVLADMAAGLERAGATLLAMACNTAHAFDEAIRSAVSVPFVSMIEEAADACLRQHAGARRVGLLAAPGCLRARLYQSALAARGLEPVLLHPERQRAFDELLYRIKLNHPPAALRPAMAALARDLVDAGADVLLAACTEVPLVLSPAEVERPLLDATWNLAERMVCYARRLEPLPDHALPRRAAA